MAVKENTCILAYVLNKLKVMPLISSKPETLSLVIVCYRPTKGKNLAFLQEDISGLALWAFANSSLQVCVFPTQSTYCLVSATVLAWKGCSWHLLRCGQYQGLLGYDNRSLNERG